MTELELRLLTEEDLPMMQALVRAEERNVHPEELPRFLALEGAHVLGLTRDGALEGMVPVMHFFAHGWLGPLMTSGGPDAVGAAVILAQRAVDGLRRAGVERVEAEASPMDAAVLAGLGFADVRRTRVLERAPSRELAPASTQRLAASHFVDVGALDAEAAGFGRKEYVLALANAYPDGARALVDGDTLRGFVTLRRARRGFAVGPLVTLADDADAAAALLQDAVAAVPEETIVALAPDDAPALPALAGLGFAPVGELVRMRAGEGATARGSATEWLIGSRMTG